MRYKAVYAGDGKPRYFKGGKEISKKAFHKHGRLKGILKAAHMHTQSTAWSTGRVSEAVVVSADGAKEAEEASKKLGVPTQFVVKGDSAHAVFNDKGHYNGYLRAFNLYDRDACYGDVTPGTTRNGGNYA